MANALPQAIGAQLTYPDRQVVSMSGDGGLSMLLGDLLTLRQVGLPVKLVVFNNASLACNSALVFTSVIVFGPVRTLDDRAKKTWFFDQVSQKRSVG